MDNTIVDLRFFNRKATKYFGYEFNCFFPDDLEYAKQKIDKILTEIIEKEKEREEKEVKIHVPPTEN